jgi:hypothetical protein
MVAMHGNSLHRVAAQWSKFVFVLCVAALSVVKTPALAATADWATSDLDEFFYTHASSPGSRTMAPTFANALTVDSSTQQFQSHTSADPARLGTALYAFNTATQITPNLVPSRYQINSVTFEATWTYEGDTHKLLYDNQPISQSEILSEVKNGTVTRQRPMELYGAGLRDGYTGYDFSNSSFEPPLISELTSPFSASDGGYVAYPIVGSTTQPGSYVDVANSVTGGYSATEPTHSTAPFTPTPWAIGKAYTSGGSELAEGAEIDDKTKFTFSLDLNAPGVKSYIQQSLSTGALGLFLSSLHSTGEFGAGGGYPKWYTRDAAPIPGLPADAMPQLIINYTILPPQLIGDYNGNGVVDAADYVLWRSGGPLLNQGDDRDHVNQQDYVVWRSHFGQTAAGSGLGSGQSVPEPAGLASVFIAVLFLATVKFERSRPCPSADEVIAAAP